MSVEVFVVNLITMEISEAKVCERHLVNGFPVHDKAGNIYFGTKKKAVEFLVKNLRDAIARLSGRLEELVGDFKEEHF